MVTMDGTNLLFIPSGEFTIYQVEEATKVLAGSLSQAKDVLIDLTRTDKIDTAGFQLLVSLQKSCIEMDKKFEITGVGQSVENLMTLFGYEWDSEYKGEQ